MGRLIDADALMDAMHDTEFQTFCPLDEVDAVIDAAPTIDAAPVRRGEWKLSYNTTVNGDRWSIDAVCSECFLEKGEVWAGFFPAIPPEIALDTVRGIAKSLKLDDFCPNCGADMRGEADETRKPV